MLYGARQVGKTYILKKFGQREFRNMVYINCYKNEDLRKIFSSTINIPEILLQLSALTGEKIRPNTTLLFFDEVQEIPDIVASLKYFCEDAPEYCVVAAGSLLGVMNMRGISFPVGKVNMLHLYPMTFIEFMEAMDQHLKIELLYQDNFESVNSISSSYKTLLRQYYFVGGMPGAVKEFIKTRNTEVVRHIQNEIINSYYSDIAKHTGHNAQRCHMVMESIPSQLARENKKFIYGALKKGARAAEYEIAIQWLIDAGLIYKIRKVSQPKMPLSFYVDPNDFKLYLLDVGLLGAMADVPPSQILIGDNIFSEYKGAFTENYVVSQLITFLSSKIITYYSKENSKVEVDFVVQIDDRIVPIEVKAEENVRSKSFKQFLCIDNKNSNMKGVRFSMKDFKDQEWMINVPLYAIIPYLSRGFAKS